MRGDTSTSELPIKMINPLYHFNSFHRFCSLPFKSGDFLYHFFLREMNQIEQYNFLKSSAG